MELMFEPRKFSVRMADGTHVQHDQLATFVGYVKGIGFRFVVVRGASGRAHLVLRSTKTAVVPVPLTAGGSWKEKGQAALAHIVAHSGEQKVWEVLRAEEEKFPQP